MCSGICCGFGADNSPHNQAEIDAQCAGQVNVTTAVQKYLIANGGWEAMKCFDYLDLRTLPSASDSPSTCADKLTKTALWAADHSNYNAVVAYGDRTAGMKLYNDTTAPGTVAAFMLMRGQHCTGAGGASCANHAHTPLTSLRARFHALVAPFSLLDRQTYAP